MEPVRAMLSMPTLWVVLVANFTALGLIWTYVMRSYPNFGAARYWTASAFCIATGACIGMFRLLMPPLFPLMTGAMLLVIGTGLAAMGVERFFGRPASWRINIAIATVSFVALNYFVLVSPSTSMRIFVYSIAQSIPVALMLTHLFSRATRSSNNPGARLAPAQAAKAPDMPEHPLLHALGHDPLHLDALQARTGLDTATLQAQLLELELAGHIARLGDGRFQRLAS